MVSTVGTSTASDATAETRQRKTFYANTKYWVFYSDGTNIVWRTSADGITWSAAQTVRAGTSGSELDVFFDGTYCHYCYSTFTSIFYRKGTLESNGNITWAQVEQTAATGGANYYWPSIAVDTAGYPYIAYHSPGGATSTPKVTKSSTNDGTWSTQSGFPYTLTSSTASDWREAIVPLATAGYVYALYAPRNSAFKGKLWTGSWSGEESVSTSAPVYEQMFSLVAQGDNVHLVFLKASSYDIVCVSRTVGWSAEATVRAGTTVTSSPTLTVNASDGTLYAFWAVSSHIYYKKRSGGTWDTDPTDWVTEGNFTGNDKLSASYNVVSGKICVLWLQQAGSPYNVRFELLSTVTYKVEGVTRDSSGVILVSCTVWLFLTSTKAYVAVATSNAVTGAYSFTLLNSAGPYFLRAMKDGTPNVFGTTDDDITGVTE